MPYCRSPLLTSSSTHKAESAGGKLVNVRPHYTAQQCSGCGGMPGHPLVLGVCTYRCEHCGLVFDRDVNAAMNIRLKGRDLYSRAGSPNHRVDAATPRLAAPLTLERCSGTKRGHYAGSHSWFHHAI